MNNYFKKIILFFCIFCAFVMPLRSNIAKANPIAIGAVEFAEGSLGGVVTGGAGYAGYDIIDRYKKEASDFIIKKSLSTLTNTFLKFYSDSSGQKYVGIDGSGLDELQSMLEDMRHSSYEGIPVFTNKTTDKTTYVDPFTPYMLNGFYMKPYSTLPANSIYDSFKISYGDTVSFFCYSTVDPSITGSASFTPINDCYIKIDSYTGSAITFRYSYDNSSWKLIKLNNGSINYINTNRSAINFIGYKTTSDTVYIPTTDVITGNGIDGKASDSIGSGVIAVPVSGQYQDDGTVVYTPVEGANVGVVSGLTKETSNNVTTGAAAEITDAKKTLDIGLDNIQMATTEDEKECAKSDMIDEVGDIIEGETQQSNRTPSDLDIPQGLTQEQFESAAARIREEVSDISDDIAVQGSRASGTARPNSDIDFEIRVPEDKFNEIIEKRFKTPNSGSSKERTMTHAKETGKIQSGEAGLKKLRKELEKLLGIDVDISIIKIGGKFDNGKFIDLP